ncbi:hypothetical protein Tsubulata_007344 [Turnera subulata]|uniref:Uncharacterized protein n=1 Tax=Turnera subulata TaxID=218843 RepID=A0A9Q0FMX2_9ROSI|nr:hypothetical protein Tsubulata_007344 [Turnera subulata]
MGDLRTLSKAKLELEELYSGIPDDSVNLTFQDLATVKPSANVVAEKKKQASMEPIQEDKHSPRKQGGSHLIKLPSLDFNTGRQQAANDHQHYHHHHHHHHGIVENMHSPHGHHHGYGNDDLQSHHHRHAGHAGGRDNRQQHHHHHHVHGAMETSMMYDDASAISMTSGYQERGGRSRRPGIPHSNICTICSNYIYIFRHRCLVCGRVYCRNCVSIGMGEMTEGRKCLQCLGRRFSQRYIQRAGMVGCCSGYSSAVKQAELKWAEKGPRGAGERAYGRSTMMSRSRSPVMTPRSPNMAMPISDHSITNPPSFVSNSPYSPYSHKHHILPL